MMNGLIGLAIVAAGVASRWIVERAVGAWLVLVMDAPIGGGRPS